MVSFSWQWRSLGQFSSRMRLALLLLASLSLSALAAGIFLRHRRRRYRAILTHAEHSGLPRQDTFHPINSPNGTQSSHRRASSFPSPAIDLCETGDNDYDGRGSLSQTRPLPDEEQENIAVRHQLSLRENNDVFHSLPLSIPTELSQQFFDTNDIMINEQQAAYLSDSDDSFHSTLESPVDENRLIMARHELYLSALSMVDNGEIKCRTLRTSMLHCSGDRDFLAKLYCVRLAFNELLVSQSNRDYVIDVGREIMVTLLKRANQDTELFCERYNDMIRFLQDEENWAKAEQELKHRQVVCMNVYDIAMDFMLMDAFCDMESPPSALLSVINNGWISDGIRRSLLNTAVWSILKAKMSLLKDKKGFMSRFYQLSETISPTFAWGFLGSDPQLKMCCNEFKGNLMSFLRGVFSLEEVRYASVHSLADDVMRLARQTAHKLSDI